MIVGDQADVMTVIPLVDVRAAHAQVAAEIQAGFDEVMGSGAFVKGEVAAAFEREYAAFTGVAHCVGVANGTDALELALRAAEVPVGTEVIMPANTFVATAEAVVRAGARPAFADVDPDYLLLDPGGLQAALSQQTGAVIPVHLFGQMAPMAAIAERRPARDRDHRRRRPGTWRNPGWPTRWLVRLAGRGEFLSWQESRRLRRRRGRADRVSRARAAGSPARRPRIRASLRAPHHRVQFPARHPPGGGAAGQAPRARGRQPGEAAGSEPLCRVARRPARGHSPPDRPGNEHVWHLYTIRVPRRDEVLRCLHDEGIGAGIHYPVPVHLQPAFRHLGYGPGDFPVAEAAAGQLLSLPLYPQITDEQQARVANAVRRALG